MRAAIVYNTKEIYVEFKPDKFLKLLKDYIEETGNIDAAMAKIVQDLKVEATKK